MHRFFTRLLSAGLLAMTLTTTYSIAAAAAPTAVDAAVLQELAPTGKLRVGVAYAPAPTPVFVAKGAAGAVHGVPRDLGAALAKALGVPLEIVAAATTGELTEACASGTIDVGFMPADDERRKRLDFSPPYFVIESTFLATGPSGITTLAEVDRADITAVGIAGSTTMRAAGRSLTKAKLVPAKSVDEAMALLKAGGAQAFALTHDSLPALQKQLPGSRILAGAFQVTGVSIAVQKNRPAGLAYLNSFMQGAKADGTVRKAFDDAGLSGLQPSP